MAFLGHSALRDRVSRDSSQFSLELKQQDQVSSLTSSDVLTGKEKKHHWSLSKF